MSDTVGVVVVDDDFMVARVHRQFVERVDGFEVLGEARTGEEALAAVAELHPDLVLLDIYLPDRSGLEVLRALRGAGHRVDVLVVTAARDVETVRETLRGGAVQYLIKPFGFEDLRSRLEEFATTRRAVRAAERSGEGVEQEQVDSLFAARRAKTSEPPMPKGLTPQTLGLVLAALRDASGAAEPSLSAAECATTTGLARVSVRRYLEYLAEQGRAEVSLRYGRAGRPERRYRWAAGP
ncbi:MAG TPA: response regulator [Segeticoccus sp.]|nr:response regulator [Segeticoccus sp.]